MNIRSIKSKLLVYILALILLLCVALGAISLFVSSNTLLEENETRLTNRAEDVSNLISTRIEVRFSELETLANRETIETMNWEEIAPILESEIERTDFATIALVDRDGYARYVCKLSK